MDKYILKVENLYKSYDSTSGSIFKKGKKFTAVNDVSFFIKQGETVGLIGESGCGKTTIGRMITGLIEPDNGKIYFNGTDITNRKSRANDNIKSKIQMIFQDPSSALNPQFRIGSILREALYAVNIRDKKEQDEIINTSIEQVGLTPAYLNRYPHELSGGQKQRICILLALLARPDLIVADEVVSALDLSVQAQILNLMKSLKQSLKLSTLFISHDLNIIYYMSDRIIVMYMGEIVEQGSCDEVYKNHKHPYTELLLNSILDLETAATLDDSNDTDFSVNTENACIFSNRCIYCKDICKTKKPTLTEIGENHYAKCHLAK